MGRTVSPAGLAVSPSRPIGGRGERGVDCEDREPSSRRLSSRLEPLMRRLPLVAIVFPFVLTLGRVAPIAAQNPTNPQLPRSNALAPRTAYTPKTSHADTLRGSFTTPGRAW